MGTINELCIPLYQQRTLVPPPTATLPTATLENFHKKEFWDECVILDRIYYKNKSQHRQAGYFKRLCECRRIVSRFRELDIAGLVDELVKKFYSGNSLKTVAGSKTQWNSIPFRSTVAFTMTRIIGAILLLRKLQSTVHETYGAFYQLMSKTQFMPLALTAIGLCSRLSLISKAWSTELVDCYVLLEKWIKSFPKEENVLNFGDYESQLPESIDIVIAENTPNIPEIPIASDIELTTKQSSIEGADLGEVIQRSAPPDHISRDESPQYSPALLKTNSGRDRGDSDLDSEDTDASMDRKSDMSLKGLKSKSISTPKAFSNLDEIFNDEMKPKVKSKKKAKNLSESVISDSSSASPSFQGLNPKGKSKNKSGSATNFDDIFNFDRETSERKNSGLSSSEGVGMSPKSTVDSKKAAKGKREIDDIFGAIKKPIKKNKGSEIEDIFGGAIQQKKKKK
ncbi:hypothetical protein BGZ49_008356 [Haplosporangium sp. Z 27]|nr:hypothetical protein BGZ49_008356 [Haplosporangium sp. Z 27]